MPADKQLAMQLLGDAVATHSKGKAGVAVMLGYGRALIARTLSPNDPLQMSDALAQRVIERLHIVAECPATGLPQPRSECRRIGTGHAPTHNPLAMRIWKICRSCPHFPNEASGEGKA